MCAHVVGFSQGLAGMTKLLKLLCAHIIIASTNMPMPQVQAETFEECLKLLETHEVSHGVKYVRMNGNMRKVSKNPTLQGKWEVWIIIIIRYFIIIIVCMYVHTCMYYVPLPQSTTLVTTLGCIKRTVPPQPINLRAKAYKQLIRLCPRVWLM